MATDTLSSRIARWVHGLRPDDLADDVIDRLRLAALDGFAAILAGVPDDVSRLAASHVAALADGGEATVIGHAMRAPLAGAVFVNGTTAHACDYDDSSWLTWSHPTAPVLPVALAVTEARDRSGRDLLIALAAGLEVGKALGTGIQPRHYEIGWHPTGTIGVFGATAAAAKALDLEPKQVQNALGIAVSCAAAVRVNVGSMTKPFHVGFAARNGMEAALLAAAGVTADPEAFEGVDGFYQVHAPDHGPVDGFAEALGNPFEVVDPGLVPKLYPCCADLHASIDAMLALREDHALAAGDVHVIRCGITPHAENNAPYSDPKTPLEAKFCQEYVAAAALVKGRVTLDEFEPDAINDPDVRAVLKRVEVRVLPELSNADSVSFSSPAVVEVETTDGRMLKKEVRELKGHPNNPITQKELEEKFRGCARRVLDPGSADRVLEMIRELETVARVRDLTSALATSAHSEIRSTALGR